MATSHPQQGLIEYGGGVLNGTETDMIDVGYFTGSKASAAIAEVRLGIALSVPFSPASHLS